MSAKLSHDSAIIVVGAGVFGMSTALHLSRAGYTNVTVFDYQPYHQNEYSTSDGADAASADFNKVMRLSYGDDIMYQRLAFEAAGIWKQWNEDISRTPASELPKGLSPDDKLFEKCGYLRLSHDGKLSDHEKMALANLEREGLRDTQYIIGDEADEKRARESADRPDRKFDALKRRERGQSLAGVFDFISGFTRASKAMIWIMHLARKAGVKFVLGEKGRLSGLLQSADGLEIHGIRTVDGVSHNADLVIVAAGGWTPSIIPDVRGLLETTAGSVVFVQLPESRQDLWDRFAPENFPVYSFGGYGNGLGLGGFPRTETGILKIGFRGVKYTNYATLPGGDGRKSERVSVPKTRYTPEPETRIAKQALDTVKDFIASNLPELKEFGVASVRNCWYTDSLDNSFVIAKAPSREGLMVCSGGSGHGFKFLPVLGREVVKIIEAQSHDDLNEYGKRWQWRNVGLGQKRNGLEEGEEGPRNWSKNVMATEKDYQFDSEVAPGS